MTAADELRQTIEYTEFQLGEAQKALGRAQADVAFYQEKLAKGHARLRELRSGVAEQGYSDPRTLLNG